MESFCFLLHVNSRCRSKRDFNRHIEEEATHNVRRRVEPISGKFFRFLSDLFDASEAAIVVVVMAVQCSRVPSKGKRETLRILLEVLFAERTSIG